MLQIERRGSSIIVHLPFLNRYGLLLLLMIDVFFT
jgi:hypothetical protein